MLRIRNLSGYYGRIQALRSVSLSVKRGEVVALIGANGAGKSTLMKAISGLLGSWRGEILFEQQPLGALKPPAIVERGISLVPEGRWIFAPLSVEDHLLLGAYSRGRRENRAQIAEDSERMMDLFPVLRQRAGQAAGTLSGGEQQMLAIARALMARPKLLLLDEPSMGLAPLLVRKILSTVGRLREQGLTILLVEQNARAALQVADRGYVLETGSVVLQGPARELLDDHEVKRAYLGRDYSEFYEGRG